MTNYTGVCPVLFQTGVPVYIEGTKRPPQPLANLIYAA